MATKPFDSDVFDPIVFDANITVSTSMSTTSTATASMGPKTADHIVSTTSTGTATIGPKVAAHSLSAVTSTSVASFVKNAEHALSVTSTAIATLVAVANRFIQAVFRLRNRTTRFTTRNRALRLKVVGPQDMAFKRGTVIEFEATFADADGTLYDPDVNTVLLQVRIPALTVLSGWAYSDAKTFTKISTGVYRITYQSAVTDTVGTWLFEMRGTVGSYTATEDAKIQVKS